MKKKPVNRLANINANGLAMNRFLTIKKMKQYLELLKNAFALNSIMSIFDNDAHRIVSKRGKAILRDKDKLKKYL
jgi:hypothetical protein